jgi:hypothetical protein
MTEPTFLITYFLEFKSEMEKSAFINHCKATIPWAWEVAESQLLENERFISFFRDGIEWPSERRWQEPWRAEMVSAPEDPQGPEEYAANCHDAVIAMANMLCVTGLVDSQLGFIRLSSNRSQGRHRYLEQMYWSGRWDGFDSPQEKLDITVHNKIAFDKAITIDQPVMG